MAQINVGAATEVEMKEKQHRIEDAVHATRAAVEEGIVPGGGVAFSGRVKALDEDEGGQRATKASASTSCAAPWRSRFARSWRTPAMEGSIVVQKVREGKGDFGFNARTEEYENLFAAGVIDPTKVTRIALENAASIASMLLTTECVISEEKEEKAAAHAHPGMGGGMDMM